MKRYQKLLVGLDLDARGMAVTAGSLQAASQARWLAEQSGARILFLHSSWTDFYEGRETPRGVSRERAPALVDFVEEHRSAGVVCELAETDERFWLEAIRRTQRGEADLVFVGRRNDPGVGALGSTSKKLLRKCPAPVWVVNPEAQPEHRCVLAATDLTPVGDRAIELAAFVARVSNCPLHVVHAWQVPLDAQFGSEDEEAEQRREIHASALGRLEETLARVAQDVRAELHVGCDSPSRAIREGVEKLEADLLVMGTVSRTGVAGLLVGNTAERLLDRVECSLLTIKPEGFVSPIAAQ